MSESVTIGMLAKRGGVNVETIRYYQRRALLDEPLKPTGGFRRYPEESVKRILFIRGLRPWDSHLRRFKVCWASTNAKPVWRHGE